MWAIVITFRPSSVVRPSTFHILIFSSETTGPITTKLWWNGPWIAPFQNCVWWSRLSTKMATKLEIEKRGDEIKKNVFLWNYSANLNQTLLRWSLGGPFSKLCPSAPSCIQDGRHYLNIEISSNGQNCSILSQKVPKFQLYKHNDELFNIYYGIVLWTLNFCLFWPIMQIRKKGGWN